MIEFHFFTWPSPTNDLTNIRRFGTSINSFKIFRKFLTFCFHFFLFQKFLFSKMLIIMWKISKLKILAFIGLRLTRTIRSFLVKNYWVLVFQPRLKGELFFWFTLLVICKFLIRIFTKIFLAEKLILILLNKFFFTIKILFLND